MHGPVPLPGDLVWIRRRRWRVERVRRDRHVVCLDVAARDRRLTFLSPFDRVFTVAGAPPIRRVRAQEARARLAYLISSSSDIRLPGAIVHASVDILPYQLEPAMAMLAGQSRLLLADEVGLGKTIQAGLIVAELARRDPAVRIIILAPASLRDQWDDELRQRFGISCLSADRAGLDAIARAGAFGDSPWQRSGIWIASPDFLKQRHVVEAMPRAPWDLVVVDEAHTACGNSERYELVHQLACRSRRVLLLTATPHSGDPDRFERLINIGRVEIPAAEVTADVPDRVVMFRRTRAALGATRPTRRVRWHSVTLAEAESNVLSTLRAFERAVLRRAGQDDQALLLLSVFRKRALSTMWALSQSVSRRLAFLGDAGPEEAFGWTQPSLGFEEERDPAELEEREGLTVRLVLPDAQERSWLRRLRTLAEEAAREERKIRRLVALLRRRREPVIVFTEFRDSLDAVRRRLPFDRPASILHGGQDAIERRHQLKLFLGGTTSVLLATDVAGQGLNLQSRARWVISLELPWNPTRLEQRIGRVDRIGQRLPTHFTLLVARDESESGLLAHLSRRIFTARRSIGGDVLATVAPPEDAVTRALLFQTPLPPEIPTSLAIETCRRWARLAPTAARGLERRRSLAAFWRTASTAPPGGSVRCDHPRIGSFVPRPFRSLFIFSIPLSDAADAFVDKLIIAIGAAEPATTTRLCRGVAAALRHRARVAVRRRIHAMARKRRKNAEPGMARERAIAAAIAHEFDDRELQPGLFDRRDLKTFESGEHDAATALAEAERALQRIALSCGLTAGDPVLEIVLSRR